MPAFSIYVSTLHSSVFSSISFSLLSTILTKRCTTHSLYKYVVFVSNLYKLPDFPDFPLRTYLLCQDKPALWLNTLSHSLHLNFFSILIDLVICLLNFGIYLFNFHIDLYCMYKEEFWISWTYIVIIREKIILPLSQNFDIWRHFYPPKMMEFGTFSPKHTVVI